MEPTDEAIKFLTVVSLIGIGLEVVFIWSGVVARKLTLFQFYLLTLLNGSLLFVLPAIMIGFM
jgi:hypothetical protein